MQDYRSLLLKQGYRIGVWGAGFIGLSTLAHFARNGVAGIAVDVLSQKVEAINRGEIEDQALRKWLGFDIQSLSRAGLMRATLNPTRLLQSDVLVHFICVPTEKDGRPYNRYLEEVLETLAGLPKDYEEDRPPLIIIESTLTPGTTESVVIPFLERHGKVVGQDILLGVAPRRDWFVDDTKSLKELDRVFGGVNAHTSEAMRGVLGIVCDRLHAASSHRTAEMVKSFENAYRHMEITLANQLSLAYPHENVREVLRLVGTKWNIGTFYPGFGVGGYCIPLSSRYVIAGAQRPEALTILAETIKTDEEINRLIARAIVARGLRTVGVLGLSYKADLKIAVLSPTIPFIRELLAHGVHVRLCDPLYTAEEISTVAGVEAFDYPDGLSRFEAVVAVVDHKVFRKAGNDVLPHLHGCRFVLDNMGMWASLSAEFKARGVEYHKSGDADWLC